MGDTRSLWNKRAGGRADVQATEKTPAPGLPSYTHFSSYSASETVSFCLVGQVSAYYDCIGLQV